MIKIISFIVIPVLLFAWIAKTTVSLHPFSIKCATPWYAFGLFLVVIGFMLIEHSAYNQGYRKGMKDLTEKTVSDLKKKKEERDAKYGYKGNR